MELRLMELGYVVLHRTREVSHQPYEEGREQLL